ncbi:MAG: LysR family transcriptional regulator [Devosia sp.]
MTELIDHRAVLALFEERHFGRAARRMGISQPALTARLRRLEESIGVRLFDRGRGGVSPTDAGVAFLEGTRRVLDAAHDAVQAARAAQQGIGTALTVGFTQITAYQGLPALLEQFRRVQPATRLSLVEGTTAVLERDLEQGALDAAVLHPPLHAPGLAQRLLWEENLVTWTLHEDGRGLEPISLPRHKAPVMRTELDRVLARRGEGRPDPGGHDADTLIGTLVLSAAGYGPSIALESFPSGGFRRVERDDTPLLTLQTAIAWRSRDRRPTVRALLDAAREVAADRALR